jgi:hypothetical protein
MIYHVRIRLPAGTPSPKYWQTFNVLLTVFSIVWFPDPTVMPKKTASICDASAL